MLKTNLPVLVIHDNVLFPSNTLKLEIDDNIIRKVTTLSESYFNGHLLVVSSNSKDINELPKIGVIAQIKMKLDMPNGKIKLSLYGISRSKIENYHEENGIIDANITNFKIEDISAVESLANARILRKTFIEYLDNKKSLGNSIVSQIDNINDISELTDVIASFMPFSYKRKISYLEEINASRRVLMLMDDLHYELSLLEYENSIEEKIEENLDSEQKKYILNEKLKAIQEELGINENPLLTKLKEKIDNFDCPARIKERLNEEFERYKLCNSNSPEIGMLRNYIDTLLSLPWNESTRENNDIASIRKVLDESHYGLSEVKERIIEFMATKKYTKTKNNPIICLVGPPGIGKTSLAKAISVALKRKCVKISVGGISDEAEITGHRRAYVGALPGKIITGIIRAGVNNPVFIIDEIDKMTKDIKGDPASSLLEVLDKEQNDRYVDHFVEEEYDLSKVMFILTANSLDKIPNELRDRLEIIELESYTVLEKVEIVKNVLSKKLRLEYHLTRDEFNLTDDTIMQIINDYTKESGVRELERLLRKMCRKYLRSKVEDSKKINMNKNVEKLLGPVKYAYQDNYPNEIGVMNLLSYHNLGGELIKVECAMYQGNGNITSSGNLGDVMQESINLSLAYLKSHSKDFKIDFNTFLKNDFIVHLTNNGIKKEGPSAGIGITTSLLSLILEKKVNNNISMSGEITLSGKILKVGGLKEKIILAMRSNIDTIYLPLENKYDLQELEPLYHDKVKIVLVDNYMEIYKELFQK